jgi:ubiquitin carboxyl-terminal hydrolase MINDY-1/2
MAELYFPLKDIWFLGRRTRILCQNENGPCPLLAIANVMILRNRLSIHPDISAVSLSELIQEVGNCFLDSSERNYDNAEVMNVVNDALRILPSLARGLDLNIKFDDVGGFEYTEELTVFDALGINVYHSWIIDDQDVMRQFLYNMSYNNLLYKVVNYRSLIERIAAQQKQTEPPPSSKIDDHLAATTVNAADHLYASPIDTVIPPDNQEAAAASENPPLPSENIDLLRQEEEAAIVTGSSAPEPSTSQDALTVDLPKIKDSASLELSESDQELLSMGSIYEEFLLNHSTQMTYTGLMKLYESIAERQLSVLFHNNHFSTIFKNESKLYLLVTDVGYREVELAVWELLDEIDGNTVFADSNFQIQPEGANLSNPAPMHSLGLLNVNDQLLGRNSGPGETVVALPTAAPTPAVEAYPLLPVQQENLHSADDADFQLALMLQQEEESALVEVTPTASATVSPTRSRQPAAVTPQSTSRTNARQPAAATAPHGQARSTSNEMAEEQARELEFYRQQHLARQQQPQQQQPRGNTSTSRSANTTPRTSTGNAKIRSNNSDSNCAIS